MKGLTLVLLLVAGLFSVYYFSPEKKFPSNVVIDKMVVLKSNRQLYTYSKGERIKVYKISLGFHPNGKKEYQNDGRTPEGFYKINEKNPNSVCHKNLGISYPNQADIDNAKKLRKPTGGSIKIHGMINGNGIIGKFHRWVDWTGGCIAVTDREMDELYAHTPIGTPIEIRP